MVKLHSYIAVICNGTRHKKRLSILPLTKNLGRWSKNAESHYFRPINKKYR